MIKKIVVVLLVLVPVLLIAQTSEQKALEAKRERLQREIRKISSLLTKERKEKSSVLEQVEDTELKINVRQELIRVTGKEVSLLNRQINANVRNVSKLRKDLEALKEDYARMIKKSYQSRSQQSKLMFLLSSKDFFQGYKRYQYIQQYAKYRKGQGVTIVAKTEEVKQRNSKLIQQRKTKETLYSENKKQQQELLSEKELQATLLSTIKKNESKYAAQIKNKQKERRAIDKQIDKLIRDAIASSNKKAGKSTKKATFALTPEAKALALNFSANKGKLIWPVEKGMLSRGFGEYRDPVYPGLRHINNGVIIATDRGTVARAVFKGEVYRVAKLKRGKRAVYIKHGNYICVYYSLADVYVKVGDKVTAKEELGTVHSNTSNGKTELKFYLYKDAVRLNPQKWIYNM